MNSLVSHPWWNKLHPWWNRRTTRVTLSAVTAIGTVGVGVSASLLPSSPNAIKWLCVSGIVFLVSTVWLFTANEKDTTLSGQVQELEHQVAALQSELEEAQVQIAEESSRARTDSYQSAATGLKELLQKIHSHIKGWSPEISSDLLQQDAVNLARDFLKAIGVQGARVSLYSPSAVELDESSEEENDEVQALSLVCTAWVPGRHNPKSFHLRGEQTEHMFEAMSSSSPSSPVKPPEAVNWKTARQIGVGVDSSTLKGLLTADSTSANGFPAQADDILILVVQFLILIDRTAKELLGDSQK